MNSLSSQPLSELCEIRSGGTPLRSNLNFYGGSIPWAKIADLDSPDGVVINTEECLTEDGLEAIRGRIFPKGTLLFAIYGSIGKMAFAGTALATNQAILGINPKPGAQIYSRFLYYWLLGQGKKLSADGVGVTQKNLSAEYVRNLLFPSITLDEQRRIAAILDKADAIRRKRRKALAQADDVLRSAFLEMFGDPVSNPMGWPEVALEDVASINSGLTKGRNLLGLDVVSLPYMRVANVQDGHLNLSDIKTIELAAEEVSRFLLQSGDILLTEGGDPDKLGRGAVWNGEIENCVHQNHIFRVTCDRAMACPDFVSAQIGSRRGKKYFLRSAKQTTGIATINKTQLRAFPLLLPPLQLQGKYKMIVKKVDAWKQNLATLTQESENLFASLSQRVFRGEL